MSPSPHTVRRDLLRLSLKPQPGLSLSNSGTRKIIAIPLGLLALLFISGEAWAASDAAVLISSFILSHAILVVLLVLLYFLPWLIAYFRGHHNTLAIFALNVLLGWTFIGWVIAFVWALTATRNPVTIGLDGSNQSTDRPSSTGGVVMISLLLAGIVGATYVYYSERIRQENAPKGVKSTPLDQPRTSSADGGEKAEIQRAFKSAYDGTDTLDNRDNIVYAPEKLVPVDGSSTYAILSVGSGVDCFGCTGALLVTYLTKDGHSFHTKTPRIEIVLKGSAWGQPPAWELTSIAGTTALTAFGIQSRQGNADCWNGVFLLQPNSISLDMDATLSARGKHPECNSWEAMGAD